MTLTQGHLNSKIKIMVFSEITGPMKVKFYVEHPCLGGRKDCARNLGRMLNMAAMLTNAQKSSSPEPVGRLSRNLVCSIWDSSPS